MNLTLNSLTYGSIVFDRRMPPALAKLSIPGSEPYYAEGQYGYIICQEIQAASVSVLHIYCNITNDLALDFKLDVPVQQMQIALKNEHRYDVGGIGSINLKEGQYNMLRSPSPEGTIYLERDNEYSTMIINYSTELVQELAGVFPFLTDFDDRLHPNKPAMLFKMPQWITPAVQIIIDQLLICSYTNAVRPLYLLYKVKELLLVLIGGEAKEHISQSGLSKLTIQSIYEARYMIETRFGEHLTMQSISKEVGISEAKLKTGFRTLFGTSLFDYVLQTRMQKAKSWLLDSDIPLKAIAKLTGYATKQSFMTAFKNFFNDTPGSFRKG